jgi:hypothetical protein
MKADPWQLSATAATLAVAGALFLVCRTDVCRDLLKGKISSGKRGESQPWKKDGDPAVPADASRFWTALDKWKWKHLIGFSRHLTPLIYPHPNLNFYDVRSYPGVEGLVALTIDDCFCRQGESHSLVRPLRELFAKHDSKATFFLTLCYSEGPWREREIAALVADGHELGTRPMPPRLRTPPSRALNARSLSLQPTTARRTESTTPTARRVSGATWIAPTASSGAWQRQTGSASGSARPRAT